LNESLEPSVADISQLRMMLQDLLAKQRVRAIVAGDFTPLRSAQVEFTTLILPDGHTVSTHTVETVGLNSIYIEPSKKKKQKAQPPEQNGGILGTAKQTARDRINAAINARSRGITDIVRGPNKKEKLIDLMWSKLPYHPQSCALPSAASWVTPCAIHPGSSGTSAMTPRYVELHYRHGER
jgi:hypothetical protein